MIIKCSECKKKETCVKGFKLKPKPLCPSCVLGNEIWECKNGLCKNKFKRKNGWLDECWTCQSPLCNKCVGKSVKVKGLEFSFCKEHLNPNMKELEKDAKQLIEEEKK